MARGGGRGGGGRSRSGNGRIRDVDTGDSKKTSSVKFKGLSYNNSQQPAFLRNAMAALSGPKAPGERPDIPERPDADREELEGEGMGLLSEDDEWGMEGDEAPTVVVLNDSKHLARDEVDRLRAQAKLESAPDPMAASMANGSSRQVSSLNLASGTGSGAKRKADETEVGKSWDEVIKRSKLEKETKEAKEKSDKEKGDKVRKKEKKRQEKKVGLLSFGDDA